MRAIKFDKFGPPEVLKIVTDHPRPQRKPGEVLVEVASTSVNPVDFKTRSGQVPSFMVKLPKVLGGDVGGWVLESDAGSSFKPGSHVYACTDGFQLHRTDGTYTEVVSVPENQLAILPDNVKLDEAGGLPLVCLTAWQALEAAALSSGQRLLIHAGAGGVGSVAVQMAKARGLHVTVTCGPSNLEFCVNELGADEAIDYTAENFEDSCRSDDRHFDAVIDLIGGSVEVRSRRVLKRSGAFVSVLNSGWVNEKGQSWAMFHLLYHTLRGKLLGAVCLGPRYYLIIVKPSGPQLQDVAKLLEEGKLKPIVHKKLPLESAAEGHRIVEAGHARGKVVLVVKPPPPP